MRRSTAVVLVLYLSVAFAFPSQNSMVVIDGQLSDPIWKKLAEARLVPTEAGIQAEMGGGVRAAMAGRYLYLGVRLPEPRGRVTARSIGRNPIWEGGGGAKEVSSPHQYTYGAPDGEDFVRFIIRAYNENDWMLQVGPLGAYSVNWRWTGEREWYTSPPDKCDRFLVAAEIGDNEWQVEAAIPLDELGSPRPGDVRLSVERYRAGRPGTPQERWRWPEHEPASEVTVIPTANQNLPDPLFQPPLVGNREPPMEVGYRKELPPLQSGWTDPGWRDVPVWALRRNEASARLPRFPTEVKLIHDGHTLAVMARCIEPDRIIAHAKDRDGLVGGDDSFEVYLATSGSSYVQYAINPTGYILDAAGYSASPRLSRPHVDWNSPVHGVAKQNKDEWIARLDLPLDKIAEVLGEARIPREWRILLLRSRPGRDGELQETSVLPVTQSITPLCPARYRRSRLVETDPSQLQGAPITERSGNLALFPTRVLSTEQRKQVELAGMLRRNILGRVRKILETEKRDWEQVKTLAGWEHFRDPRLKALAASLGKFPPRSPLHTRVTAEFLGDDYRRQNLVYQSQPGLWVTANLYLPAEPHRQIPGIIIVHSLHGPKTQFELQDMGIIWARGGCAVLVMDQIGYGERIENYPWDRENYHSRYITGMQLYLAGESLMKWMVWDIMRGVDLLLEREDINKDRIILLGAVAGGGDPAAVTAALDSRVTAVVPFNFGEATPEVPRFLPDKNQWPLDLADPGLDDWDSTRCLRRGVVDQFLQWTVCALVAPRRFVYSYELGWDVKELPAWARYEKVFSLYNALDHLAEAHGFGPFPGPGECWNIGPAQRRSLYPTLERWFGIPIPFRDMQSSQDDNLTKSPVVDRRPESELAALTPAVASELRMRSVHELAHEEAQAKLHAARAVLARLTPREQREWIQTKWAEKLGDIEPNRHPEVTVEWSKKIPDAEVEGIALSTEPGIIVPLLLLRPTTRAGARVPVVVAVAEGGKDLFMAERSKEIEALLKDGLAVCLPDVRGTGETSPDFRRDPDSDESYEATTELMLGETLLGKRLKDLRTVLAYLSGRPELDRQRVGVWGDSFTPANPTRLVLDEFPQWQIGPEIEQQAEPLGGFLALLSALYEPNVRTLVARRGLASYLSVLDDRFAYVPADTVVPGILEVGDVPDAAAALAPRPMLLEGLVDGRNHLIPYATLKSQMAALFEAYGKTSPAALCVRAGEPTANLAEWFRAQLK